QTMEIKLMNSSTGSMTSAKFNLAWFTCDWGKRLGLLLLCLATVTIAGAYAGSNRANLLKTDSDKTAKSEHAFSPARNGGGKSATAQVTPQAGALFISEFRLRGPNGANDEYIE